MKTCLSQPILKTPLLIALVLSLSTAAIAQVDWTPDSESPEEHDWIKLSSGEWLKGKFEGMIDGEVEFDSIELKGNAMTVTYTAGPAGTVTVEVVITGDELQGTGETPGGRTFELEGIRKEGPPENDLEVHGGGR